MKKTIVALSVVLLAAAVCCRAQQDDYLPAEQTLWLKLSTKDSKAWQYLQLWRDGAVLVHNEAKKSALTRKGTLRPSQAESFFRAINESAVFEGGVRYRRYEDMASLELLELSAYRHGELRYARMPLALLETGIKKQLAEIKNAADKMPPSRTAQYFLLAEPLARDAVSREEYGMGHVVKFSKMETAALEDFQPLAEAVYKPRRLMELPDKKDAELLKAFISKRKIKDYGGYFYLDLPRGKFKVQLLNANK
ncbi:MAG TPA: hypothetical protein PLL10_01480 [Elusimicrobiales bacterium]|nr:hypothetical protein [Elusimicrobiales bacterium]